MAGYWWLSSCDLAVGGGLPCDYLVAADVATLVVVTAINAAWPILPNVVVVDSDGGCSSSPLEVRWTAPGSSWRTTHKDGVHAVGDRRGGKKAGVGWPTSSSGRKAAWEAQAAGKLPCFELRRRKLS